jgi:tetratricopeptide (TPR) repeat protein
MEQSANIQPQETPAPAPEPSLFDIALAFHKQEKNDEAIQAYRRVLLTEPNNVAAWRNLGSVLRKVNHFESSIACLKRALELQPGAADTLTNLGNSYTDMDMMDAALDAHAQAVAALPENFLMRKNYVVSLRKFGKLKEALAQLEKVFTLRPDDEKTRWEYAVICLHLGLYKQGWEAIEVRWKLGLKDRDQTVPRWHGEDLTGKTILVYKEQGFGDTILCSRYLPMVKARGARVLFECQKQLHRLFEATPGIDKMADLGAIDEKFDYQVPMLSLPWIFETNQNSIPPPPPLSVPDALPPAAKQLLDLGAGRLKVGIVWSGSITFLDNAKRAVTAERFLPLAGIPGVQLYSLQKGPREQELVDCGGIGPVITLGPHLNDFADTAAVVKELDLVIMTDSSTAHLTASMGKPVWNLLNYAPYWLYKMKGDSCAWYPSMRLFRQPTPGDWDSVFKKVADELTKAAQEKTVQAKAPR